MTYTWGRICRCSGTYTKKTKAHVNLILNVHLRTAGLIKRDVDVMSAAWDAMRLTDRTCCTNNWIDLKTQYLFTLRKSRDTYSNMSLGVFRIQCVICPGLFYSSRSIWHCADTADCTFRLTSPNALRIALRSPPQSILVQQNPIVQYTHAKTGARPRLFFLP